MRGVAILALVLAAVLAPVLAADASSATTQPALRLVDSSPLTVRGVAFQPRERVRVVVRREGERLFEEVIRAGRLGRFTVTFEDASLRCGSSVQAVGRAGSRATLKLPQLACPPRLSRP